VTADDCPVCAGRWPRRDHRIADLDRSIAYLHEDQFFPGWTVLVLKRHATELFQLGREERAELIEEVSAVAQALAGAFKALKLNYELLGNLVAHIHWHVVPRLPGDPAPRGPAWLVEHAPRSLDHDELSQRIALIRSHLT
jgi:diadenosine tetraphosphate (Ap4A) HIT family hydrolase